MTGRQLNWHGNTSVEYEEPIEMILAWLQSAWRPEDNRTRLVRHVRRVETNNNNKTMTMVKK